MPISALTSPTPQHTFSHLPQHFSAHLPLPPPHPNTLSYISPTLSHTPHIPPTPTPQHTFPHLSQHFPAFPLTSPYTPTHFPIPPSILPFTPHTSPHLLHTTTHFPTPPHTPFTASFLTSLTIQHMRSEGE